MPRRTLISKHIATIRINKVFLIVVIIIFMRKNNIETRKIDTFGTKTFFLSRGQRMNYYHRIVGGRVHVTNETRNKTNEGETKYSMATMTVNSRPDVV